MNHRVLKRARAAAPVLAIVPLFALGGCHCGGAGASDSSPPGSDAGSDAAPPGTDAASDGGESGPPPIGDAATSTYVMDTFTVPAPMDMVGFDLDGDSTPDNALAEILAGVAALAGATFDAQAAIDQALVDGTLLYLLALDGVKDPVDDPQIMVTENFGEDTDGDPTNNLLGGAMLRIAATSVPSMLFGPVTAGRIHSGPADLPLELPLGTLTIATTLEGARLEADIDVPTNRLLNGLLGGALPQSALEMDIYPAIADLVNMDIAVQAAMVPGGPVPCVADVAGDRASMDCAAGQECTAANAVDTGACIVADPFSDFWLNPNWDADGDGVLTGAEVTTSPIIDVIIMPDIDTDGDSVGDAVSFAVQFTAVDCLIVP